MASAAHSMTMFVADGTDDRRLRMMFFEGLDVWGNSRVHFAAVDAYNREQSEFWLRIQWAGRQR